MLVDPDAQIHIHHRVELIPVESVLRKDEITVQSGEYQDYDALRNETPQPAVAR